MRKSWFSEEQIIGILKRIEAGQLIADVCREVGTRQSSDGTYYRWKAQYGGLEVSQLRRLRQLEDENQKLKAVQKQQHPRFPQFEVAVATVWRQLILSAVIAVLGFVSFILTLLWDQQLWLAAISLLVGFVAALYALWLSISLQRFYATTTHANANTNTNATERAKTTR